MFDKRKEQITPSVILLKAMLLLGYVALLASCNVSQKVCPAYQSAFVYDTAALRKKFSYFVNDTPKIYEVSKNKFLLIEPSSYRKTLASFRTIEMLPIYPVIPDSLKFTGDDQMRAEMDVVDSVAMDSITLHPGLIGPGFNVEQENYMYYFRKILILPDVRQALEEGGAYQKLEADKEEGKKGFFKRIFGKKNKEEELEEGDDAPDDTEEDVVDDGEDGAEKSGMFNRLKGKKKGEEQEEVPPPTPEETDDNEDDDF
ncbi:MAG: hypothetical protein OEX02_08565 [Cyclobacteriaceae bacterium]|nr:hypothetical protein [Cyclobacteriaceae bacterium]